MRTGWLSLALIWFFSQNWFKNGKKTKFWSAWKPDYRGQHQITHLVALSQFQNSGIVVWENIKTSVAQPNSKVWKPSKKLPFFTKMVIFFNFQGALLQDRSELRPEILGIFMKHIEEHLCQVSLKSVISTPKIVWKVPFSQKTALNYSCYRWQPAKIKGDYYGGSWVIRFSLAGDGVSDSTAACIQ